MVTDETEPGGSPTICQHRRSAKPLVSGLRTPFDEPRRNTGLSRLIIPGSWVRSPPGPRVRSALPISHVGLSQAAVLSPPEGPFRRHGGLGAQPIRFVSLGQGRCILSSGAAVGRARRGLSALRRCASLVTGCRGRRRVSVLSSAGCSTRTGGANRGWGAPGCLGSLGSHICPVATRAVERGQFT